MQGSPKQNLNPTATRSSRNPQNSERVSQGVKRFVSKRSEGILKALPVVGFLVHGWDRMTNLHSYSLLALSTPIQI